jgi:hypothetical protein
MGQCVEEKGRKGRERAGRNGERSESDGAKPNRDDSLKGSSEVSCASFSKGTRADLRWSCDGAVEAMLAMVGWMVGCWCCCMSRV